MAPIGHASAHDPHPAQACGSISSKPSSRRANAPEGHASTQGASAQCAHSVGVYDTRTTGTCPRSFSFTFIQNWPVGGWGAA